MPDNFDNKDPIEKLFQKKAGDYDISYNEADWLNLEKRLDIRDQQLAARRRQRWFVAASVLILSLLGYFTYENYSQIQQISQQLNREVTPREQPVTPPAEDRTAADTGQKSEDKTDTDISADSKVITPDTDGPFEQQKASDSRLTNSQSAKADQETGSGELAANPLFANGESIQELFVNNIPCADCMVTDVALSDQSARISSLFPSVPENDITDASEINNSSPALSLSSDPISRNDSRIALGLVLAPDMSTVGSLSNFYDPGYKFGLTIEYRLGPNISVSTGVIQSKVRYQAQGNQYNPPSGYWSYGNAPSEATGVCLILDIPVNVKIGLLDLGRSRFYTTAGISSYIMLNEHYDFNYKYGNNESIESWSDNTGTRHWMSNAGFSIGYEVDMHSHWSLRAEPFVKVPLREVGWANVKLYSIGSFVSINYKL